MILHQHTRVEMWPFAALLAATFTLPIEAQELPAPGNTMLISPEEQSLDLPPDVDDYLVDPAVERHSIPLGSGGRGVRIDTQGDMISLVAHGASIGDILASLARTQELNLIAPSEATARINISLERVPLETALDSILGIAGYTWTVQKGIILVTDVSSASRLPPSVQGRVVRVFELDFASADDVDLAVKGLLSPLGQSFILPSSNGDNRRTKEVVTVEDLPSSVARIEQFISQLDQPPRQVLIETHVLKVELKGDIRHGVNFDHLASLIDPRLSIRTHGFANPSAPQAFFIELDGGRLDGLVEALKTTTDAKTLASPRILALNGQESRIQVGEQLGFRVTTTTETSSLESVDFLNVGVVLRVTPTIGRDGQILMNVQPEVSSGEVNPETGLPEEQTTELQTDVLLCSGYGMIIGGLIKDETFNVQSKVPLLGDVPYLGAVFERRQVRRSRSEVIIALIPHVLPYGPQLSRQNDMELLRATSPLVRGPLCEAPRPYEPRLPDPLRDGVNITHRAITAGPRLYRAARARHGRAAVVQQPRYPSTAMEATLAPITGGEEYRRTR